MSRREGRVGPIYYVLEGEGPALTLSHSLAADLTMWDREAAHLAGRFTVLRFDTRGHGRSDAVEGPTTMADLAQDAVALLDELGIAQTHWVGLSLGGMIGEVLALSHPGRIGKLVLADTTAGYPPESHGMWRDRQRSAREGGMAALVEGTVGRWFTPGFAEAHPDRIVPVKRMIENTKVAGYVASIEAIISFDVRERLGEIRHPTLVIVGAEDQATPVAKAEAIHAGIAGSRLVVIPEAAHVANLQQPEAFREALDSFL